MNDKSKERIIGSIVLLCLAIIFIPPFYDGRNPFELELERDATLTQIPQAPHFKKTEASAADIADIGSGRIDKIETKVKNALPQSARSDSSLATDPTGSFSKKLTSFNTSEMTSKLINEISEISESSEISSRFNSKGSVKQAWAVQVGSFEEAERATKLRDELVAKKFQAYIKTVSKNGLTILRVFAGVSLDKSVAEKIKLDLENNFAITTAIVVPYQP